MLQPFHISSLDRLSVETSTNFTYTPLIRMKTYKSLAFRRVIFPISYYEIRTGINDRIDFTEGGGGELNAVLNAGNYNLTQMQTEVKRAMDAVSATTYTITISLTSGLLTATNTAVSAIVFLWLTGTNTLINASYMLGFSDGVAPKTNTASATTITSTYPVELQPSKNLYLDITTSSSGAIVNRRPTTTNIIVPITINGFFQNLVYQPDNLILLDVEGEIGTLHIRLTFLNGELVNLGGKQMELDLEMY